MEEEEGVEADRELLHALPVTLVASKSRCFMLLSNVLLSFCCSAPKLKLADELLASRF